MKILDSKCSQGRKGNSLSGRRYFLKRTWTRKNVMGISGQKNTSIGFVVVPFSLRRKMSQIRSKNY